MRTRTAGVRACIRGTARTSLALLLVVFPASPLARLWPRPATRWLLRNRRYLGLSLAVSQGFHLVFIVSLSAMGQGGDTSFATVYGGGLAYALLAVMAVRTRFRELLLPILMLPALFPILAGAVDATRAAIDGSALPFEAIQLLLVVDGIYLVVGFLGFDTILDE